MNLSPDRIEQKAKEALAGFAYFVFIARPHLVGLLRLFREQRVEIEQMRAQLTPPEPGCTLAWIHPPVERPEFHVDYDEVGLE